MAGCSRFGRKSADPRADYFPGHGEGRLIRGEHAFAEPHQALIGGPALTAGRRPDGSFIFRAWHPDLPGGQSLLFPGTPIRDLIPVPEFGGLVRFQDG